LRFKMPIDKPVIFISHAATDRPIAEIIKSELDRVFANGVHVFASSVPGVMKPGVDWLNEIRENLENATAVVVLITPVSINRPWIWFEVGAYWSRLQKGSGRIYPLCAPEIDLSDLPEPLNRLQALSLGKAEQVKFFFQELCDKFGFGNMKGFKGGAITKRLPKYTALKIDQSDIITGTIYSGPYEGYSDGELEDIIDENYIYKDLKNQKQYTTLYKYRDESIFNGKLIHYQLVDEKLKLPPGTSKRLLKKVAARYNLKVDKEGANTINFHKLVI
jgi:hypothetical protein